MLFIAPMTDTVAEEALKRAKKIAGGDTALADLIGRISPQGVNQWKICPPGRVLAVEKVTGVSRHELRPDVFGEVCSEAQ